MERINKSDLESLVKRINEKTGNSVERFKKVDGKHRSIPGHYYISGAYGGVELLQLCSEGGAVSSISHDGHDTKRKLYDFMRAFLDGLNTKETA